MALLLAAPPACAGSFTVEQDPRWELVAAAARLSEPPERRAPTRAGREADRRLEGLSSHPAVERAGRLLREGGGCALVNEALEMSWPPVSPPWSSFSREKSWRAYDAARASARERERALAVDGVDEAEARFADWHGRPLPPRRLWPSPLAATAWDCDAPDPASPSSGRVLARAGRAGGVLGWEPSWAQFGHSIEHEAAHAAYDSLVPARLPLAGVPPKGCNDGPGGGGWSACLREHLALAATINLHARRAGQNAAEAIRIAYAARGYPYLSAVGKALESARRRNPASDGYAEAEKAFVAAALGR